MTRLWSGWCLIWLPVTAPHIRADAISQSAAAWHKYFTTWTEALGPSWHSGGISGFTEGIMAMCEGQKPFSHSGDFLQAPSRLPSTPPPPLSLLVSTKVMTSPQRTHPSGGTVGLSSRSGWSFHRHRSTRPRGAERGLFTNTVRHMAHKHITARIVRTHTHRLESFTSMAQRNAGPYVKENHIEGEEFRVFLCTTRHVHVTGAVEQRAEPWSWGSGCNDQEDFWETQLTLLPKHPSAHSQSPLHNHTP